MQIRGKGRNFLSPSEGEDCTVSLEKKQKSRWPRERRKEGGEKENSFLCHLQQEEGERKEGKGFS